MSSFIDIYDRFLSGPDNPMAHTTFDEDAIKADERFIFQVENYVEPHIVWMTVDEQKLEENPDYLEELKNSTDLERLGFDKGEEVVIKIIKRSSTFPVQIEVELRTATSCEAPSLYSEKSKYFDALRKETSRKVKEDIKAATVFFDTQEKLRTFINQQHQFCLDKLKEFYRRRRLTSDMSSMPFSESRKPNETNLQILSLLISDLWGILKFIESNYSNYLNVEPVDMFAFEASLRKPLAKKKPKWKKILIYLQALELKPNFAGLGIDINKVIELTKRKPSNRKNL